MPMNLRTTGFQEMQGELDAMRQLVRDDATRSSVQDAAAVIREAMYERAPILDHKTAESTSLEPRELKEGMRFSVRKLADGFFRAIIGPRRGTGRAAHLVEYGHRLIKGGRSHVGATGVVGSGKEIGEVPAHPFLRPGFEASVAKALDVYRESLKKRLGKWVN